MTRQRVCIFGSREGVPTRPVFEFIESLPAGTSVVVGGDEQEDPWLKGVDALAAGLARRRGLGVIVFRADWAQHGKAAGPIRNAQMADFADYGQGFRAVGRSNGTDNCQHQFRKRGKPVAMWKGEPA